MVWNRMTPEEKAREKIDQMLAASGWVVQDYKALNLATGPGARPDERHHLTTFMPATNDAPLSENQRCMLALALACDLQISKPFERQALRERHKKITTHQDTAAYIQVVENKIRFRRKAVR
jgi:hypothetical protein